MKTLISQFCLAAFAFTAFAAEKPAEKPKTLKDEFNAALNEASKNPFQKWRGIEIEKLLQNERFATNAAFRLQIEKALLGCCKMPGEWQELWKFDQVWADENRPKICNRVMSAPDFKPSEKRPFAFELMNAYAGVERYADAEKIVRELIAIDEAAAKPDARALYEDYSRLASVYRWQDRKDDMMATFEKMRAFNPLAATREGGRRAMEFGGCDEKVDAWWKDCDNAYEELCFFAGHKKETRRDKAFDYVMTPTNRVRDRLRVYADYFLHLKDERAWKLREELARVDYPAAKCPCGLPEKEMARAFKQGDYGMVVRLRELYAKGGTLTNELDKARCNRLYVVALGAVGRAADGAKFAEECLEGKHGRLPAKGEKGYKATDHLRYRVYADVLSGKDAVKSVEAFDCEPADRRAAILSAARQCQIWGCTSEAERYSAKYMGYFGDTPRRRIVVKWFDEPIANISDWRRIEKTLEHQTCDLKFNETMTRELLETDVASGRKFETDKKADGKAPVYYDLSAACDRNGVHVFLRAKDPDARKVEAGYNFGIGVEMYFAPGADQPYTCLMADPRKGVNDYFHTAYTSAWHQRMDPTKPSFGGFRSETGFSDDDYVLHLFFAWDDFYQKLPTAGTDWKFEALCWCPGGARTWGGSISIHSPTRWGNLRFELTPAQLTAVKRGILARARSGWSDRVYADGSRINRFLYWGDLAIGDPDFSNETLGALSGELGGLVKRIKPDMTDEEV
ncbi:MAG: hypothetical protein MJ138_06270, partial [Kiritimatiellae bacterium]|nr:hypothetical protein [Kiritimatiellia bacterium]